MKLARPIWLEKYCQHKEYHTAHEKHFADSTLKIIENNFVVFEIMQLPYRTIKSTES